MEEFKNLTDLVNPDQRNQFLVLSNKVTGDQRSLSLEDVYSSIESIRLIDSVPDEIVSQFNVAKNLSVYSWFCYSFHQVADLKAFSATECALRSSLGKEDDTLKKLLKTAVDKGLLNDENFSHLKELETGGAWVRELPEVLRELRNKLAHGSSNLYPGSSTNLRICADIINQLFSKSE